METSNQLSLKVHRIRFFVSELTSINAMSYNEDNHKLAVIRRRIRKYKSGQSDTQSVVEIWNMRTKAPFIEQTIYDNSDNPSLLESLLWGPKDRLFSCGLNANINEYDLKNNRIKRSYNVRSGAVWCMSLDASQQLIAVGTEDGLVCVYRLEEDSLDVEKVMDRSDNRILCVEWHRPADNTSPLIITGSIDYIKIWNYQTGRCIDNIKVGDNGVVIWCLAVLQDFTIISGDSKGNTSFWDGRTTALITSYGSHKGDVLCVCVDTKEMTVYSSGVDPSIVQFTRTMNKYNSWVNSTTRRLHTHDVRALTCVKPNWLLSGGIDTYLTRSCYPPNLQLRHLTDYSSKVTLIKDYVCLQYETYVQIWKLGKSQDDFTQTNETIEILTLSECASKLADIKSRKPIITASFNDKWIAYSNFGNIKIKAWDENCIKKVPLLYEPIGNCTQMTFCGQHFLVASSGTALHVLKLDVLGVVIQTRIDFEDRIYSMTSSDKYLAVCTSDSRKLMTIYDTSNWTQISSFPNDMLPTAFQINRFSAEGDLWIAYPNHKLLYYCIKRAEIVKSIQISECISEEMNQSIDQFWTVRQITFATNAVIFSDDNILYKLDTNVYQINKCEKYRHILRLGNGCHLNELIVVELTPERLFNLLPQSLATKKYGT